MSFGFALDEEEAEFRAEVLDFVRDHLPGDMAERSMTSVHPSREDMLGWTKILATRGWSVPHWPVEHGGTDWTPRRRHIFEETVYAAGAPPLNMQAISLVGPVIFTFGNDEQKRRFLPAIRAGETYWAQGFSEPNSGSDLASLRTTALRDGDTYLVNGQKIWTSHAHFADWLFLLVRTNPDAADKRDGISFLVTPVNTPGITIRPIVSIDGGISLCETFLENVRVPAANLIGEEGKGWAYANFLLGNERTTSAEVPRNKRMLARLKDLARSRRRGGRPLIEEPAFAARVASLQNDIAALETSVDRVLSHKVAAGRPTASTLKLRGTEILQALLELQVETLGTYGAVALPVEPQEERGDLLALPGLAGGNQVSNEYLYRRAATIYGGTSEIQRTIIAKALLRLNDTSATGDDLSEDQRMLADSVRRFTERSYDPASRKKLLARGGADLVRENWKAYAQAGWLAMAQSETAGGLGSSAADIAVVMEGLGAALALEPFLPAGLLAPRAVEAAAGGASAGELLAGVADGTRMLALAHQEPEADPEHCHVATQARKAGGGYTISGIKSVVLGAPLADTLIVSARTSGSDDDDDGITLFQIPRDADGLSLTSFDLLDGRKAADVRLEAVHVPGEFVLGEVGRAYPALLAAQELAIVALCAETVGVMERALWITRDYAKARRQFNAAIADFQAVQHRLADMYVDLEQARSMLHRGLAALRIVDPRERSLALSATKAHVGRAARRVGAGAVQLHGGIGITDEYVIGHYFKRLMVNDILFGDWNHHLARVAAAL